MRIRRVLPVFYRIVWIVTRLVLVYWLSERGLPFYYQGF